MGQVFAGAQQRFGKAVTGLEILDLEIAAERPPDGFQRDRARALVQADADLGGAMRRRLTSSATAVFRMMP